jgi:hypothetical protein
MVHYAKHAGFTLFGAIHVAILCAVPVLAAALSFAHRRFNGAGHDRNQCLCRPDGPVRLLVQDQLLLSSLQACQSIAAGFSWPLAHLHCRHRNSGARTGCINASRRLRSFPQELKPRYLCGFRGTAEAVPFQSTIYATSSSLVPVALFAGATEAQGWICRNRNSPKNPKTFTHSLTRLPRYIIISFISI